MRSKRKEGARVKKGRTQREVGEGTQKGKQFKNKDSVLVISFLDVETIRLNGPKTLHPHFLPAETDSITTMTK